MAIAQPLEAAHYTKPLDGAHVVETNSSLYLMGSIHGELSELALKAGMQTSELIVMG